MRLIPTQLAKFKLSNGQSVSSWPTVQEVIITALLAIFLTALDLYFSSQLGLLSTPPRQDGLSYMALSKEIFYRSGLNSGLSWFQQPARIFSLFNLISNIFLPTPVWYLLLLLSFLVFGEGEWQCYTVRFWPMFLLLLLMVWVVRRRGNAPLAWLCAIFTALLPTISVNLHSSSRDYFTRQLDFTSNGYLADLRPDLLFAVLLLWTVVPLVENVHHLGRRSLLVSGIFAGLAVLCKASASPMLLLAWGLAFLYILAVNRHQLLSTVRTCLWGVLPFGLLLAPYALAGGAKRTFDYLFSALTTGRTLYANPNATFFSEAKYYWSYFPSHIGHLEGWLLLGTGLVTFLVAWFKLKRIDSRLLAYLGLSLALYVLPSLTPNKNFFVGLPYYLLLWLFSWIALTPVLLWASQNRLKVFLIALVSLYATAKVTLGLYALQDWPVKYKEAGLTNRATIQEIATDLRTILSPNDCFVPHDFFGFSSSLLYYMMNSKVFVYQALMWEFSNPPQTVLPFIKNEVPKCKAILTLAYHEDMQEIANYFHGLARPYFRAVAEMVRQPDSKYRLLKQYPLFLNSRELIFLNSSRNSITIEMYVKQS